MRPATTIAAAALTLVAAGCGGTAKILLSNGAPAGSSKSVTRAAFHGTLPFTVDYGVLGCGRSTGVDAVGFDSQGRLYGLNGLATDPDYLDVKAIWAKDPAVPGAPISLGDMIDHGRKLCDR